MKRLGRMETIPEARRQLERLLRANLQGNIEPATFRNLCYGFSVLLQYHKAEMDQELEDRITEIEEKLGKKERAVS